MAAFKAIICLAWLESCKIRELQQRLFKKVVCFKLILSGESSMALQLYNHAKHTGLEGCHGLNIFETNRLHTTTYEMRELQQRLFKKSCLFQANS